MILLISRVFCNFLLDVYVIFFFFFFANYRCKRFDRLALHPIVLSKAGPKAFEIQTKNWSESTHRFLKLCVSAGNVEACYTLGMVRVID